MYLQVRCRLQRFIGPWRTEAMTLDIVGDSAEAGFAYGSKVMEIHRVMSTISGRNPKTRLSWEVLVEWWPEQ